MRLYTNAKVEFSVNIDLVIGEQFNWKAEIKKYKTKPPKILSTNKPRLFDMDYKQRIHQMGINNVIGRYIRGEEDLSIVDIEETSIDINHYNLEQNELSDTELNLTEGYVSKLSYQITFIAYGKFIIGKADFEDSFETMSGLHIDEILPVDQLEKFIYDMVVYKNTDHEYKDHQCKIRISFINFDDDVKLLPNDVDIVDVIEGSKSEITSILENEYRRNLPDSMEE